jgi:FlaA1/EpsC-like NDP-sugar epimerase
MGEPIRIMDLARRTIELSGQDVAIEIVGIRPGEKLHEELFNVDEEVRPTRYGKIMRATRPPLDPAVLHDGIDELGRRIAAGRPEPVAEVLWSTLRGARTAAPYGETRIASPIVTHPQETP